MRKLFLISVLTFLFILISLFNVNSLNLNIPNNLVKENFISAEEAMSKVKGNIVSVSLEEEKMKVSKNVKGFIGQTRIVYNVRTVEEAKALALIPTSMNVNTKVDAETGEVVSVVKPWWSFLTEIFK